ncbi:hypothetical protein [Streptomyces sp. NBC_01727]|uniref:hypothetical protein n=1 Tax=Streptomyces sp. NBC_01727 TaxID=2975924 RepID=UPI002E0FC0C8|nr:hypothetical protein OIE76_03235 [Streptomyces sp. NBC_01727]
MTDADLPRSLGLIVTTPRGGSRAPLADTLAVLRQAGHEAGVDLTIVADES